MIMGKFNLFIISVIGLCTMICSCHSDLDESLLNVTSIETKKSAVEQYVNENKYIDLDVVALSKEIASPKTRVSVDLDKIAQMKAAIYRFYSHVKLVDGLYVCSLTDAAEINVSTKVYDELNKNLNDINKTISEAKKNGQNIVVPEVNDKYLKSLLK